MSSLGSLSHLPPKVTTLKLANNNFTYVSEALLDLPKYVRFSHSDISDITCIQFGGCWVKAWYLY